MTESTLASEAAALIEPAEDKAAGRLSPADRSLILSLAARDQTQAAIAAIIGCDQSTVSRVLGRYRLDTRADARALLESSALEMAESVVAKGDPALHAKMLAKLDVIREDRPQPASADGSGVTVGILFERQHGWCPAAPLITIDAVAKQTE